MEKVTQAGEACKVSLCGAPQVVVVGEGIAVAGVAMSSAAARELAMELVRAADRVDGVGQPAIGWWAGALRSAAKALRGSDHAERLELIADGLTPAWSSAP